MQISSPRPLSLSDMLQTRHDVNNNGGYSSKNVPSFRRGSAFHHRGSCDLPAGRVRVVFDVLGPSA